MHKTYTVGYMMGKEDTPFIRLSDKWLKEQSFNIGDKLKYISSKNMIILVKMPAVEILEDKKQKNNKTRKTIKKITNQLVLLFIYFKIKKLIEEIKFKDDYSIVDNRYSYNGYQINKDKINNYSIVEEEIKKVFLEYDPEVFEFLQNQKDTLNYFDENLFERFFSKILFNLNKKSLMDIFGIDGSYKDSSYKK